MAHEGNHICLYRFSFHKSIRLRLVKGRLYLPITTYKSTAESVTLKHQYPPLAKTKTLLFFFTELFVYSFCVIIRCTFLYDVIDLPDPGYRFL